MLKWPRWNRGIQAISGNRKGSTAEVKCQLYFALAQNYIDEPIFSELSDLATETGKIIGGLTKYLRRSGIKDAKYKRNSSNA
jgi:hypothetical protein